MHTVQLPSVGQDSRAYHPVTAAAAREIIATEGQAHSVVVYFEKKDGTVRRMVARYYGHTSAKRELITVWDVEKGALRAINLETVHTVKVLRAPERPQPAADREAVDRETKRQRFEDLKAELAEWF